MWVFLNSAFLSIVEDQRAPKRDKLLVRARFAGDIERAFPKAKVASTPDADYPYRASVPRAEVAKRLAAEVERIDYPSFKDSLPDAYAHGARESAYYRVWFEMQRAGDNANRGVAAGRGRQAQGRLEHIAE
jgi:hypothetical protein